ncbi:hypothetical protein D3C72_1707070 [compost metagenome]
MQIGDAHVQALVTGLAKLAEHLEVTTTAGEDTSRSEQQLIQVALHGDACLCQCLADGLIAATFIDTIFFIQVQCLHLMFAADLQEHVGGLVPGIGLPHQ